MPPEPGRGFPPEGFAPPWGDGRGAVPPRGGAGAGRAAPAPPWRGGTSTVGTRPPPGGGGGGGPVLPPPGGGGGLFWGSRDSNAAVTSLASIKRLSSLSVPRRPRPPLGGDGGRVLPLVGGRAGTAGGGGGRFCGARGSTMATFTFLRTYPSVRVSSPGDMIAWLTYIRTACPGDWAGMGVQRGEKYN